MIRNMMKTMTQNEGVEALSGEERREFLKLGLKVTGVFAGGSLLSLVSVVEKVYATPNQYHEKYPYKPHYSMVLHVDRCVDCEKCIHACAKTNDIPAYGFRTNILERQIPDGIEQQVEFLPVLCNQCNVAQCARVCPTSATYKSSENGIVMMDVKKCIGCLSCQVACPYNARYFNEEKWAVDKCNFCFDTRLSKGEELTACADACPAGVRIFGDISEQTSRVYREVHQVSRTVWVLRPEAGTKPNVFYTRG